MFFTQALLFSPKNGYAERKDFSEFNPAQI